MLLVLLSFFAFLLLIFLFALEIVAVFAYELTKLGLIWCVAGLILAPLAGLATRSAAHSKAMPIAMTESPWHFGAIASACFVIPWIYIMIRIYHEGFHTRIKDSQVSHLAYAYLALGPMPFFILCAFAALLLGAWLWALLFLVLFVASVRTFCRYWLRRSEIDETGEVEVTSLSALFHGECMIPFFMASLCTIAAMASFRAAVWSGIPNDFIVFFTLRSL